MSFKAMKFRVYSERKSAEIQQVLFLLGYAWPDEGMCVQYTVFPYLYAEEDGSILHGETEKFFLQDSNVEYALINDQLVCVEEERASIEQDAARYRALRNADPDTLRVYTLDNDGDTDKYLYDEDLDKFCDELVAKKECGYFQIFAWIFSLKLNLKRP